MAVPSSIPTVLGALAALTTTALVASVQHEQKEAIFGSSAVPFLAGAAVTLGIGFSAQLLFLIFTLTVARSAAVNGHMVRSASLETGRTNGGVSGISSRSNSSGSNNNINASTRSTSSTRVKSVPYCQTNSPSSGRKETKAASILSRGRSTRDVEADLRTPPGSSGGGSDTMASIRTSFSQVIRPITSKTRLVSPNSVSSGLVGHSDTSISGTSSQRSSAWRPISLAGSSASPASTCASRERDVRPSIEDFDSWDTSAVDPQNRLTVLESSTLPAAIAGRFLETIPASPTTSRSPSPGTPLDLEPPRSRQRRSRSYSPSASSMHSASGARLRSQSHSQSPPPPPGEAHIHPLFRSDSPTPPPAVSAGTVVTAAPPNASQMTVTDAQSLRTLNRMRSGSLPAVSSPLSRQGSFDDFGLRRGGALSERPHTGIGNGHELREEDGDSVGVGAGHNDDEDDADRRSRADSNTERKMTPPIPEWILSAGARTSLSGYQSRKVRVQDGAPC
ncbi:hypothetical protein HMPREF1624_00318 [Sporothrix schenckii ATCC 58251]|uniref:Uncharacterized protein n=1 Tax=Sporothrix schenckii (strain ATCC 58251 / de Perez 2211183) TaxID=1391915 RepID=U7Q2F2_SPOS1|nr:hypothetical protein HMPREF1624_00318 [Sporothrix schenckii ATCC 58251]